MSDTKPTLEALPTSDTPPTAEALALVSGWWREACEEGEKTITYLAQLIDALCAKRVRFALAASDIMTRVAGPPESVSVAALTNEAVRVATAEALFRVLAGHPKHYTWTLTESERYRHAADAAIREAIAAAKKEAT